MTYYYYIFKEKILYNHFLSQYWKSCRIFFFPAKLFLKKKLSDNFLKIFFGKNFLEVFLIIENDILFSFSHIHMKKRKIYTILILQYSKAPSQHIKNADSLFFLTIKDYEIKSQ